MSATADGAAHLGQLGSTTEEEDDELEASPAAVASARGSSAAAARATETSPAAAGATYASPFKSLAAVRASPGQPLRVFSSSARRWLEATVLQAGEGAALVQLPGQQDATWVDVRSLGDGMIAGFERVHAGSGRSSPRSTPATPADDRLQLARENLRNALSARKTADAARQKRALSQSPPRERSPIALTGWHTPTGGGRTRSFLATCGARCSSRRGQS